tara:strand:- start:253 stop:693 length:441 start_codon:yes stop_codon:yes gene_type:complete
MSNITIYTIYSSLKKILKKLWPVFREFFIIFVGGIIFFALFWGAVGLFLMFMICFVWIADPATWSHSLSFKEWGDRNKIINEAQRKEREKLHAPVVYVKHLNKDNEEVLCCKQYCNTSLTKDSKVYNDTRERIRQIKEKDLQKRQI